MDGFVDALSFDCAVMALMFYGTVDAVLLDGPVDVMLLDDTRLQLQLAMLLKVMLMQCSWTVLLMLFCSSKRLMQ